MYFLNNGTGYALYKEEAEKKYYVDKSLLIDELYRYVRQINKYICITRPRRFGKSVCANMIAGFFDESVAEKSHELFMNLDIGKLWSEHQTDTPEHPSCWVYQGKKKVVHINFNNIQTEKVTSYQLFCDALYEKIESDISHIYPIVNESGVLAISDIFLNTGDRFVFVIDEWDSVLERDFMTEEDRKSYILLLKALFKDQPYVDFVYMTGILPISKYTSGSPLNMFTEFTSFGDGIFYPWFGLTKDEIQKVMKKRGTTSPTIDELEFWYDGYVRSFDCVHMYNPTSVSAALAEGTCRSHWTGTGPMNEVRDTVMHNVKEVREDVIRMTGGETLNIKLTGFSVEKPLINSRDEILSSMVVYGFLTYFDESLAIPNHELMLKFQEALYSEELGLKQTLDESKKLLRATLERKHTEIASCLEELHNEKIPFFHYNDENSLACVVTMGYIAAVDRYRIIREDKAGKGYVDFLFIPMRKTDMAIILELKYNRSAGAALKQIHERDYIKRLKDFTNVLLVGINYSEKTKKHTCLTELVEQ